MFKSVKDGAGNEVADDNIVRSIEPTHGIRPDLAGIAINPNHADLQIIGPNEKTTVQSQLAATYGGLVANVLGYGYVARKNNGNARDIGATNGNGVDANNCTADSCKGYLTLAFKVPVPVLSTLTPRSSRPTVFSFIFALGDQTDAYTTQSIKDQKGATPTIAGLPTDTFFGQPRLLAGSTKDFYDKNPKNLCQVTTAEVSGTFTTPVLMPATLDVDNTSATLNTCFGSGGLVGGHYGDINSPSYIGSAIRDSQNRIVVAGYVRNNDLGNYGNDFAVWRFKTDGTLDGDFSGDGYYTMNLLNDQNATDVALDSQGRIVVVGEDAVAGGFKFFRLTDTGLVDLALTTADYPFVTDERDPVVDTLGDEIYIAGTYGVVGARNVVLARRNANGTVNTTFDSDGYRSIVLATDDIAYDIDAYTSSQIFVGATSFNAGNPDWTVIQVNENGVSTGINGSGTLTFDPYQKYTGVGTNNDELRAIKVDSSVSGRLVMAGSAHNDFAVARYDLATNTYDATFGTGGVSLESLNGDETGRALDFAADGSIIVAGTGTQLGSTDFAAVKFNTITGAGSTEYGETDIEGTNTLNDVAHAVVVDQITGKITLVGEIKYGTFASQFGLLQYNP
jgi:uncharacterized delta-60 repeat protein